MLNVHTAYAMQESWSGLCTLCVVSFAIQAFSE